MVSIFIDLAWVKIRIGNLQNGSVVLKKGGEVVLTTRNCVGTPMLIPVEFKQFYKYVSKGSIIFLMMGLFN